MPETVGRFFDTMAATRDPRAAVRAMAIDLGVPGGPGILDPDTFRAMNTCRTTIGQASLYTSL